MKFINGYGKNYSIKKTGEVIVHKRKRFDGRVFPEKIMKVSTNNCGYKLVTLVKDRKTKRIYVHRLMAKNFLPNKENKPCVNHKNGNKADNRLGNLEWCTYSENAKHSFEKLGRVTWNKGNRKYRPELVCGWCKQLFTPKKSRQKLCSQKCASHRNLSMTRSHKAIYLEANDLI